MIETATPAFVPAGFGRRAVAAIVDSLVLTVPGIALSLLHLSSTLELFFSLVVAVVYFSYFHGVKGQTPGNAALSIRLVDHRAGTAAPIGYPRAARRWAVSLLSWLVVGLGYFWMLWDDERQTWHDKAVGSQLVDVPRSF